VTTDELFGRLLEFGRANSVTSLVEAGPYLEALGRELGEKEVQSVSARDLHDFHTKATPRLVAALAEGLRRKSVRWEAIYSSRSQDLLGMLPWESDRPVAALVELLDRPGIEPRRVLELGCGDGVNAVFMAQRGCEVTAVDISATAIEMARRKALDAGVNLDLLVGDVFELGLDGSFDLVFDRGLLHHLQVFQFEDYCALVADRLRTGGLLHLICHHISTRPTVVLDAMYGGAIGKLLGFLTGPLQETGCGFSRDELRQIFSPRFEVESIELIDDDNKRPFRFESALLRRA
jgi:2-polyprenyl-3-methyl-5-hydroxy-6-metoxy-1,4-benzoquinol methylase